MKRTPKSRKTSSRSTTTRALATPALARVTGGVIEIVSVQSGGGSLQSGEGGTVMTGSGGDYSSP